MKFARNVHFQFKNGKETELNTLFEKEVLPMLRKQDGFEEEVTLLNPKGVSFGVSPEILISREAPVDFRISGLTPRSSASRIYWK